MKYYIPCSYGEIVDKWTILQIKLSHAHDSEQKEHIQNEHTLLGELINNPDDPLINQLHSINTNLWDLEDSLRLKSKYKVYDQSYIDCAESIHINNDLRYRIKRALNMSYNSDIVEEKIYTGDVSVEDIKLLSDTCILFKTDPVASLNILEKLHHQYGNMPLSSEFMIDLYMSYKTNLDYLGLPNDIDRIHEVIEYLPKLDSSRQSCYNVQIALAFLDHKCYLEFSPFAPYLQHATGPTDIKPETTGYLKDSDIGKTMLIYTAGGLGDIIMHGRFLLEYCTRYNLNKIILLCCDPLIWMFRQAFKDIHNLNIIEFTTDRKLFPYYDYHNNITSLFSLLHHTYETIPWLPYLKDLWKGHVSRQGLFCEYLTLSCSDRLLIGWKGNIENEHDTNNRSVPLELLLQSLSGYPLMTVQREITEKEYELLVKYNVQIMPSHAWDQGINAFYDTVSLLNDVKAVISSDTSLLHLAGSIGVKTIALLVAGCDWRWTKSDKTSRWYPNMVLLRQKSYADWSAPLNALKLLDL